MKKNTLLYIAAAMTLLAACSDDLAGTYSDYSGDGPIRYTGKCTNVSVDPGWECLRAKWTLSNDPAVKNIRVTWISEDADTLTALLPPTDTAYTITGLSNQNYQVTVQSIAEDGTASLADVVTRRPYTYEHETVTAFTQGTNKYFFYHNHLLLFMGTWTDGIVHFVLDYTGTDGRADSLVMTREVFDQKHVDIAGVDLSKPVVLHRRGTIEGCPDTIDFQPLTLETNYLMNTDFKKELRQHYGLGLDDINGFAATAETVDLDYDLYSLEDLLYFTNLKRLNLGGGRYMVAANAVSSTVTEQERAQWVIQKLHDVGGVTINDYNGAYLGSQTAAYVNSLGIPEVPVSSFYNSEAWSISTSISDDNNTNLAKLIDGSNSTDWQSWPSTSGIRSFDLVVDMRESKAIHGVAIVQSESGDMESYTPEDAVIEYATEADPGTWHYLNSLDSYQLGGTLGETTIAKAATAVNARYIRVTVKERTSRSITRTALAEIKIY